MSPFFQHVANGLHSTPSPQAIPFDVRSWLRESTGMVDDVIENDLPNSHLPIPNFVEVFEYNGPNDGDDQMRETLGLEARMIVDNIFSGKFSNLEYSGSSPPVAVLFRGLREVLSTPKEFSTFWQGCCCSQNEVEKNGWKPVQYVPFAGGREQAAGVDLTTNFPPEMVIAGHNEMVYNPHPPGKIAFYCLQDAPKGGETILARNADLTKFVPPEMQEFVKDHGGVLYQRKYHHETNAAATDIPYQMSWQKKTGTTNEEEAIQFFAKLGFDIDNGEVYFDDSKNLIVKNVHSGFIEHPTTHKDLWFNIVTMAALSMAADGTTVPKDMLQRSKQCEWKAYHAYHLNPGEWIVLNNKLVQHGRLPYVESKDQKRTILTVYTE